MGKEAKNEAGRAGTKPSEDIRTSNSLLISNSLEQDQPLDRGNIIGHQRLVTPALRRLGAAHPAAGVPVIPGVPRVPGHRNSHSAVDSSCESQDLIITTRWAILPDGYINIMYIM